MYTHVLYIGILVFEKPPSGQESVLQVKALIHERRQHSLVFFRSEIINNKINKSDLSKWTLGVIWGYSYIYKVNYLSEGVLEKWYLLTEKNNGSWNPFFSTGKQFFFLNGNNQFNHENTRK